MNRRMIALVGASLLCVSSAVFASPQQKPPAKASTTQSAPAKAAAPKAQPTHTTRGTVSAVTTTQLTLSTGKGKKDLTFMLGSDAQKPASLAAGDKVTVHYRVENNQNMVTSIQSQGTKNAGNTAKKKT